MDNRTVRWRSSPGGSVLGRNVLGVGLACAVTFGCGKSHHAGEAGHPAPGDAGETGTGTGGTSSAGTAGRGDGARAGRGSGGSGGLAGSAASGGASVGGSNGSATAGRGAGGVSTGGGGWGGDSGQGGLPSAAGSGGRPVDPECVDAVPYEGSINAQSQSTLDALALPSMVDGSLTIGPLVESLAPLRCVRSITGELLVTWNVSLESLAGLERLESVGSLRVANNYELKSLGGLDRLTSAKYALDLVDNDVLADVSALAYLGAVGDLQLEGNPMLTSLAFPSLARVDTMEITASSLTSLRGLEALETVGAMTLSSNSKLTTLDGLSSLREVEGTLTSQMNYELTSIAGLAAVDSLGSLIVESNQKLSSLDGLEGVRIDGDLQILNNGSLEALPELRQVTELQKLTLSSYPLSDIRGLSALESVNTLDIFAPLTTLAGLDHLEHAFSVTISNTELTSLAGLENLVLDEGGSLKIGNNSLLTSLSGLSSKNTTLAQLAIVANIALTDLEGLEMVTSVTGSCQIEQNDRLASLKGLENLESASTLDIRFNQKLTSLAALGALTKVDGALTIDGNSLLPTCDAVSLGARTGANPVYITSNQPPTSCN